MMTTALVETKQLVEPFIEEVVQGFETTSTRKSIAFCEVDGEAYTAHAECADGTILVGPGHHETRVNQHGLCANCAMPREERVLPWVLPISDEVSRPDLQERTRSKRSGK